MVGFAAGSIEKVSLLLYFNVKAITSSLDPHEFGASEKYFTCWDTLGCLSQYVASFSFSNLF